MQDGWARADPPIQRRSCWPRLPEKALQRSRSGDVSQARQRLLLDLAHALARDTQERADLLEGHRLFAIKPEVEAQDLRLALLEARQRFLDRLGQRLLERLLVRRRVDVVGEVIEQLVVFT